MTNNPSAYEVSAILFEEGDWWSAQCLEYDIAAQAKTLSGLLYEVERVLISHLCIAEELGRKPFEGLEPAPNHRLRRLPPRLLLARHLLLRGLPDGGYHEEDIPRTPQARP